MIYVLYLGQQDSVTLDPCSSNMSLPLRQVNPDAGEADLKASLQTSVRNCSVVFFIFFL